MCPLCRVPNKTFYFNILVLLKENFESSVGGGGGGSCPPSAPDGGSNYVASLLFGNFILRMSLHRCVLRC